MFDLVRAVLRRAKATSVGIEGAATEGWVRVFLHVGVQAVLLYRYGSWAYRLRLPILRHLLAIPYWLIRFPHMLGSSVSISQRAQIGPGFVVHTWGGVFIPPIKAGRNFYVQHGVVIGHSVRSIGDDVYFGPGSKAFGNIHIGNNVEIGANVVVNFSVPDDHVVLPVPSRAVPRHIFGDESKPRIEGRKLPDKEMPEQDPARKETT